MEQIARTEPWDLGDGGYQVGNFPALWSEWNGKYRDCIRRFWKRRRQGGLPNSPRGSAAPAISTNGATAARALSINFVTAHDGFTLNDLVSYDHKHNEANGEENRDGTDDNLSWNCGVEGPTDDPKIRALRETKNRNFLATLLLSQGAPMLLAGDEIGHTQQGNNNAYCQDNELTWLNWNLTPEQESLLKFVRRVIALFHEQPVFHRRRFFHGKAIHGKEAAEIAWLEPSGAEMTPEAWQSNLVRSLGVELFGGSIDVDEHGEEISGDTMLLLFNGDHGQTIHFTLPVPKEPNPWELVFDTAREIGEETAHPGDAYDLLPCSMVVLRSRTAKREEVL